MSDDGMKRVGLVFKTDGTVDFKKSLSEVNNSVNENRTAFKLAQSEWDKNTTALKKMQDRQEYLTNQTDAYSEKVKQLNEILESQENAQTRDEAAISKTKQALNSAQASLNYYEKGLEEVTKQINSGAAQLEEYSKKLDKVSENAKKVGGTLSKTLTAGITATATAAGAAWVELDNAYDGIAAGTGAVGDALADLQDSFDNVYGNFPESAANVSTSIADINTRFGFTGQTLEDCSKKFLEFSQVNNTDVSSAIQNVSRYMGDAGIKSSEYTSVLDALTAASQGSGIAIDNLTELLTKYGAPMRALGFETQESIAMFAQWEKAGVNTEIAFSGMKKAISNWASAGKDAKVEFKNTLDEIAKCPDIASATTLAIETFGTKAGPDLADAIQGGRFSIEEFMKVVENSGGTLDATWGEMQDGPDKVKASLNDLKIVGADLADTALSSLAPVIDDFCSSIKDLKEWFDGLSESQKETILKVALIVAAIGPAIMIVGQVCGGISKVLLLMSSVPGMLLKVQSALSVAKGAVGAFNAVLAANHIILVVGIITVAIAALVAGFIYLWNNCEGFRQFWIDLWDTISSWFSEKVDGIEEGVEAIHTFFTELPEKIQGGIDSFKEKVSSSVEDVKGNIEGKFTETYNNVDAITNGGLSAALSSAKQNLSNMKSAYDEAGGGMKGIMAGAIEGIKGSFQTGFTFVDTFSGGKLSNMVSNVSGKMDEAHEACRNAIERIKKIFDFDWHFPKLKLPHFSATGSFSLKPLKVPTIDVDWYANGGILNQPTIFGANGNSLLGGGEAGKEVVAPLTDLKAYMREVNAQSNVELVQALKDGLGDVFYNAFIKALRTVNPSVVLDDEKVGEFVLDLLRKEVFA